MRVETNLAIFFVIILLALISVGSQRQQKTSTFQYKILALLSIVISSFALTQIDFFSTHWHWLALGLWHIFSVVLFIRIFTSKIFDKKIIPSASTSDSNKNTSYVSAKFSNIKLVTFFIRSNILKIIFLSSSLLVYCTPFFQFFENNFSSVISLSLSFLALALITQIAQNMYHLHQRDELCQTTHSIIQKMLQDSDTYVLQSVKQYLEPIEEYWNNETAVKTSLETPKSINQSLKNTFQHIRQACQNYQHIHQLSDQLRTPIKKIITPLKMAFHSDKSSSQTSRLVELAYQNAKNTLANIDRVMEVQEIESGKLSINIAPFSPYSEIQSAIHSIKLKAKIKQLHFLYKIDPALDENLFLMSDGKKIQRLLVEVLENAVRTTSKGKIELHVSISPSPIREELPLKITVQDTGSGQIFNENDDSIPLTEDLLFNKKSMQHLTIAKTLTEYLGGTCNIQFAPNVGTLVEIHFLFKKVFELAKPSVFKHSAPSESHTVQNLAVRENLNAQTPKPYVLVVDADPIQQHLLTSILRHLGVNSEIAQNGLIAIEKIKQKTYHLILIDYELSEISSSFISNLIKLDLAVPPVIAITELMNDAKRKICIDSGMQDCLSKPISFATLKKVIDHWCHMPNSSLNRTQDSA